MLPNNVYNMGRRGECYLITFTIWGGEVFV